MGGDLGPKVTVPGALKAIAKYKNLSLVLVGDKGEIQDVLKAKRALDNPRVSIHHTTQKVEMDESPAQALRFKKDSSMRVAINLVKNKTVDACVSAGNTGALMATARFVLKTIAGIDRPAIVSTFPTMSKNKNMRMLDLGANIDSTADHLFQFAVMGSVLASAIEEIHNPSVSLLNIGQEDIKGNELVKQAHQKLLNTNSINYSGFIEGDQIYKGKIDVVVCDGFVGNVALKTTEGVAKLIAQLIKDAFNQGFFAKLAALVSMPVLKFLKKRLNPDRYNGATLLGLQGIVIKSHGGAQSQAFFCAIKEAIAQVSKNVPSRISAEVENILKNSSSDSNE